MSRFWSSSSRLTLNLDAPCFRLGTHIPSNILVLVAAGKAIVWISRLFVINFKFGVERNNKIKSIKSSRLCCQSFTITMITDLLFSFNGFNH